MMSPRFPLYVLCCGFCVAAAMSIAFGSPDAIFGLIIGWASQNIAFRPRLAELEHRADLAMLAAEKYLDAANENERLRAQLQGNQR